MSQPNREIKSKIIAKAWKDPKFKKRLMEHPREALKEFGINVPDKIKVTVLEEKAKEIHICIPYLDQKMLGLSDKDLQASGGDTGAIITDTIGGPLFSVMIGC